MGQFLLRFYHFELRLRVAGCNIQVLIAQHRPVLSIYTIKVYYKTLIPGIAIPQDGYFLLFYCYLKTSLPNSTSTKFQDYAEHASSETRSWAKEKRILVRAMS
jgi:hypothetical protein